MCTWKFVKKVGLKLTVPTIIIIFKKKSLAQKKIRFKLQQYIHKTEMEEDKLLAYKN